MSISSNQIYSQLNSNWHFSCQINENNGIKFNKLFKFLALWWLRHREWSRKGEPEQLRWMLEIAISQVAGIKVSSSQDHSPSTRTSLLLPSPDILWKSNGKSKKSIFKSTSKWLADDVWILISLPEWFVAFSLIYFFFSQNYNSLWNISIRFFCFLQPLSLFHQYAFCFTPNPCSAAVAAPCLGQEGGRVRRAAAKRKSCWLNDWLTDWLLAGDSWLLHILLICLQSRIESS